MLCCVLYQTCIHRDAHIFYHFTHITQGCHYDMLGVDKDRYSFYCIYWIKKHSWFVILNQNLVPCHYLPIMNCCWCRINGICDFWSSTIFEIIPPYLYMYMCQGNSVFKDHATKYSNILIKHIRQQQHSHDTWHATRGNVYIPRLQKSIKWFGNNCN